MADIDVLRNELVELRSEVRELRSEVEKLKDGSSGGDPSEERKPLKIRVTAPGNFGSKFHMWNITEVEKAPQPMPRPYGALKGNKVYFTAGTTTKGGGVQVLVHYYDLLGGKWSTLPKSTQFYSSLVIIQDMVTQVGGKQEKGGITGDLLSFQESGKSGEWIKCLPPLPTPRYFAGSTSYENIVVVVGGETAKERTGQVDIMDTETMQWTTVSPLPVGTSNASVVIIGDTVYALAGEKPKGTAAFSNQAFSCSLTALVASSPEDDEIWTSLPDLPVDHATAGIMNDTLVAIGGWTAGRTDPLKTMHAYSTDQKKWTVIGYMSKARGYPGVVQLNEGSKTLVVGGQTSLPTYINEVEIIEAKN